MDKIKAFFATIGGTLERLFQVLVDCMVGTSAFVILAFVFNVEITNIWLVVIAILVCALFAEFVDDLKFKPFKKKEG
jgi:hypothetical protein